MTDRPRARLEVSSGSDELAISLAGELDMASLPSVAAPLDELLGREAQPVVLDLSGLTFLDSSGVTLLVRIANHFGQVRTHAATEPVRRVVEVLGLSERFGMGAV